MNKVLVSIRTVVLDQIASIAKRQGLVVGPLSDDTPLMESGLDSLGIAILVAQLEDELGVDPFMSDNVHVPSTIGDFIRLYENAAV